MKKIATKTKTTTLVFLSLVVSSLAIGSTFSVSALSAGIIQLRGGHSVELVSTENCGDGHICYNLSVSCNKLNSRNVTVKAYHNENSQGSVLFTSGGDGSGLYGANEAARSIIGGMKNAGYETFEVIWRGPNDNYGWADGNAGAGFNSLMCGYAEVAKFINNKLSANKNTICATGNSGGSMQISYGLTIYHLDRLLDFAVLSGGPPAGDLKNICFGNAADSGNTGPARLIDFAHGWAGNGDYCVLANQTSEVVHRLENNSLVPKIKGLRDYNYDTVVSFIQGASDLDNIYRGKIYYDAIESEKSWDVLSQVGHQVHQSPVGAEKILGELIENCKE